MLRAVYSCNTWTVFELSLWLSNPLAKQVYSLTCSSVLAQAQKLIRMKSEAIHLVSQITSAPHLFMAGEPIYLDLLPNDFPGMLNCLSIKLSDNRIL